MRVTRAQVYKIAGKNYCYRWIIHRHGARESVAESCVQEVIAIDDGALCRSTFCFGEKQRHVCLVTLITSLAL